MFAIEVDGGLIAYRREGRGTPVVALHSSASSSGQWKALRDDLADRHCVVMPDLPGYGETTERPKAGSSGGTDTARPIIALIEHGATPVHLVGHSYGGALAVLIAIHRPDLVRSLTRRTLALERLPPGPPAGCPGTERGRRRPAR